MDAPPDAESPEDILAEVIRRDEEIESGKVRALTEEEFWASVKRLSPIRKTGAEIARELADIEHLGEQEAEAFETDLQKGRQNLIPPHNPWS